MYKEKKKYFLFPKLYSKHLLFLYFFIISCFKRGIQIFFEKEQKLAIEFIELYLFDLGDFLSIIPLLVMKKRMMDERNNINKTKIQNTINEAKIKNLHFKLYKKKKCGLYSNIFTFVYVDFIGQIASVIFYVVQNKQNLKVKRANLNPTSIFNIIAILLFSICLLHTKIYRHHVFSIIVNMVCFIVLTAIDISRIYADSNGNFSVSIIFLLVKTFSNVLYSLENVVSKIIFLYYYLSTFELLVWKAAIDFVNLIIFSIPFAFIELQGNNEEQKTVFEMIADVFEKKIYILICIVYMITNFFYTNMCLKIIDTFSPNHFVISRLLENIATFIFDLILNGMGETEDFIIRIISFILLILAALIYNEFLVINICGLGKYTKLFLDYEAKRDFSMSQGIIGIDDEDNDSNSAIEIKTYIVQNNNEFKDSD